MIGGNESQRQAPRKSKGRLNSLIYLIYKITVRQNRYFSRRTTYVQSQFILKNFGVNRTHPARSISGSIELPLARTHLQVAIATVGGAKAYLRPW